MKKKATRKTVTTFKSIGTSAKKPQPPYARADDQYDVFESVIADRIASVDGPLFTTDTDPDELWDIYLDSIPADRRQVYNCRCCEHFIKRYGGLVTIQNDGVTHSVLWDSLSVPPFFRAAAQALHGIVTADKVTGVFLTSEPLGTAKTGEWGHLHGTPRNLFKHATLTAGQAMAEKREDFKMLSHALRDYPRDTASQALRVLESDTLNRSEKVLGVAKWFNGVHNSVDGVSGWRRLNRLWYAVATAPPGFCHIRSTMIATLLDDIVSGLSFDTISKRWAEKMHPLQYQRPTAPPKEGNIAQAEAMVERLGVAPAFARRFATLDDVLTTLWTPSTPKAPQRSNGGIFGHLRNTGKSTQQVELPTTNITWAKFQRDVLDLSRTRARLDPVRSMEILVPVRGHFYGLVTASNPDAPAIIQWDGLDGHPRNPVSWYFYTDGSYATSWGLTAGWNPVRAVFLPPHQWQEPDKFKHQGMNVHFTIAGAKDARASELCLFPEILKSEFHGIRSVIEAHSKRMKIEQTDGEQANGLALSANSPVTVRVTTDGGVAAYTIDRFE